MNSSDRALVRSFIAEFDSWKIGDTNPPIYLTQRRMAIAEMILTEIQGDDLECLAVRAWATAATDRCISPDDVPTAKAFVAAKRHYLEMLQTGD
jgi:hypothetical protein